MTHFVDLIVGNGYILSGLKLAKWDTPHPRFGKPDRVAARYLGSLQGVRRWHGFEVWANRQEQGVLFMNDADIEAINIAPMS